MEGVGEQLGASGKAGEHGCIGFSAPGPGQLELPAQCGDEAGCESGRCGELCGTGRQTELVGIAGIHSGQQRGDQPLEHLVAEAGAHQVTDRLIISPLGVRSGRTIGPVSAGEILGGPGHAGGADDPGGGEGIEISGDPEHETGGERAQRTVGPDPGRGAGRGGQKVVEAEFTAQVHRVGHPGEEGIGAAVDHMTEELPRQDPTTDPRGGVDDGDAG